MGSPSLYEPLLLTTGVAGAILLLNDGARRGPTTQETQHAAGPVHRQLQSLAVWSLLALVLQVLRPGSSNTESVSSASSPSLCWAATGCSIS